MNIHSKLFSSADSTFRDGLHAGAGALTSSTSDSVEPPVPATPATEEWVNEGGSDVAPAARQKAGRTPTAIPGSAKRSAMDTPEWCRERAAADLIAAGAMDTVNGRLRFEHSAVSWVARADLLQRLKDGSDARQMAAATVWPEGDASASRRRISDREEPQHVRL